MSLALNQDPDAFALLEKAVQDRSLKLAIPQVCFMEAFATIRNRVEESVTFQRRLEREVNQLERSTTSPVARQLLDELIQTHRYILQKSRPFSVETTEILEHR